MSTVCIGFMGAGKSTAPQAREALGIEAIDVDAVLRSSSASSIEQVFAEDGEAAFRAAEERVTLELLGEDGDWSWVAWPGARP